MLAHHNKRIDRLTIGAFEKQESCPWCRSVCYSASANLRFNTAYQSQQTRFLMDYLIIRNRKVVRCSECGLYYNLLIPATKTLIMMSHGDNKKQIKQEKDPVWSFRSNRNAYDHAHLLQVLIPIPYASVLDIGCYEGRFLSLLPHNWRLSGLEPDPNVSNSMAGKFDIMQDYIESDNLPWPSDSFDAITMFDVLEHCRDIQKALSNVNKLLKPNGWLMIETGNASCLEAKITGSLWWYFNLFEHFVFFDPASTTRILSDSGFDINTLEEVFHINPKSLKKAKAAKSYIITALAWIATLGGTYTQLYRFLSNAFNKSGRLPKLYGRNHMFILARKKCGFLDSGS